ncbi:hypothetical protein PENTCL1PPCAC_8320, partial [Pristionchus entomophagus]
FTEIVVSGSRIFIIDCVGDRDEKYLNKIYIFDLEPTLFDRAQAVILGNEKWKKVAKTWLPRTIK